MAKILIVDDHPDNRDLLTALVESLHHVALRASDGVEGLKVTRQERPDLVISDILMPRMDGYDFVRHVRADPAIAHTEVIFYTAYYHDRAARALAEACGVKRILLKPSEPSEILAVLAQALDGSPQPAPEPVNETFDDDHLRVMTDKLSEKVRELQAINQRFGVLTDLNLQLASEKDPHRLLVRVCHGARELLGACYAALAVGNKDEGKTRHWATSGLDPAAEEWFRFELPPMREGVLAEAFDSRSTRRITHPSADSRALGLPAGFPPVHSLLVAPIVSLRHVYGWLALANKKGADEFDADDERLLQIHAAQVGRIYENGSLNKTLSRLNRVHSVLSGIRGLIVRVKSAQDLADGVCRIAVEAGGFSKAWAGVMAQHGRSLRGLASQGMQPADFADTIRLINESWAEQKSLASHAVATCRPAIANDARHDTQTYSETEASPESAAVAVLPIVDGGRTHGLLALYVDELGFFDGAELSLLADLTRDIAFALDHLEKTAKVDFLAFHDPLTGLPNRRLLVERIAQMLASTPAEKPNVAVVSINLNRFSTINRTLGKDAGDAVLKEIARRLAQAFAERGTVARMEADRYAVAVPGAWDAASIVRAHERYYAALFEEPIAVSGQELRISGTIGLAFSPTDGLEPNALVANSEAALKRATAAGDRMVLSDPEMNLRVSQTLAMEGRLRLAIERSEFVLHYQPKVDLTSRTIVGLEALIRWLDPEAGLVPPLQFIPLMEETGMILAVGAWALDQAVSDRRRWLAMGLAAPRVAVNVSAIQMRDRDFVATVERSVAADVSPTGLDLEITESIVMDDVDRNIRKLQAIRDLGVSVAIDDFGTGYSSLAYLTKLPVQSLKIDRSFISRMLTDPDMMTLAQTIISLAHSLNLKVIAEGVETAEQEKILRLLRCDQMQGFLFSKPLPFDQLTELLAAGR